VGAAAPAAIDRATDDGYNDDNGTANHHDDRTTHHDDRTGDHDHVPGRTAGATGTTDDNDDGGRL
jgi:hypothetical protein